MSVEIRAMTSADGEGVFALLRTTMMSGGRSWPDWDARWQWSHASNPVRAEGVPLGLIAERDGHVVGHLGLTPVPLAWQGETVIGQSSEAFAISPDLQGEGVGRRLAAAAWDASPVPQPVSFTANPTSTHLFAKFGGVATPPDVNRTRLAPLEAGALVARLRSGGGRAGQLARVPGVGATLRAAAALWLRGLRIRARAPAGWTADEIEFDHPEIESLALKARRPGVLEVAVDARYLAWRYEATPPAESERYHLVGVRDPSGQLGAVAAIGERTHEQWNGCFAQLMELVGRPELPSLPVLASLVEYGRARRWVALRLPSLSPELNQASARIGFFAEPAPSVSTVVKPVGRLAEVAPVLSKAEAISLGLGCRW
jgi:GNAT superfamily N-acetyltransferase